MKKYVEASMVENRGVPIPEAAPAQEAQLVAENMGDLSPFLKEYLGKEKSRVFLTPVTEGQLKYSGQFDESFNNLLKKVIEFEGMKNGELQVVILNKNAAEQYADQWHDDDLNVYIYSNKFPTQILRNPEGRYTVSSAGYLKGNSRPQDVWTPPQHALVRLHKNTIHRRDPRAVGVEDRYLVRVQALSV